MVESLNDKGKLAFTKTRETADIDVTLVQSNTGIMPDYTYSGTGVRADGVSEGRPAQKAGLKAGDVIIQLGEHTCQFTGNLYAGLGKFKKGDKTKVKYKRGNETMEAAIEF